MELYPKDQIQFYNDVLDFLERVCSKMGAYVLGDINTDRSADILILNFTKVVNDCRAMIYLINHGFYIQAGIIARSTNDACLLMMHISYEGNNASLLREWLGEGKLKHWDILKTINRHLRNTGIDTINIAGYANIRKQLDDFVHGNYCALKLYPAQASGPTPMDEDSFNQITKWTVILNAFLVSCLLIAQYQLAPEFKAQSKVYIEMLTSMMNISPEGLE